MEDFSNKPEAALVAEFHEFPLHYPETYSGPWIFLHLEMSVFLLLGEPWQPSVGCGIESIPLHSCTEGPLLSHFLCYTRSLSVNRARPSRVALHPL